jgi:capsid portal protein
MEFKLYSSRGPYGLPRWIGNLKSALGSIETEDMNLVFFANDSMPPMAIMVEGGCLQKGAEASLKKLMQKETRGTKNKFKTLILEASADAGPASSTADGKVRIKIQPLTQSMIKEGLFMAYDQKNRDKIGESFRLPKILRGDSSDVNRATADAAISLAEQQVFSSIRNSFDYKMDREIFTDLEVRYFEFESLGPDLKNAESLAAAAKAFSGALKGNELRKIAGDVFGRQYPDIDEAWGNIPLALALAGVGGSGAAGTAAAGDATKALEEGDAVAMAAHLAKLRKMIHAAEGKAAAKEFAVEKGAAEAAEPTDEHVIQVPAELLAKWVQLD